MPPASKAAPTLEAAVTKAPESQTDPHHRTWRKLPGNQTLLRLQGGVPLGPRDDAFEREADATADRIMRRSTLDRPQDHQSNQVPQPSRIQRAGGATEDEEIDGAAIQRKAEGAAAPTAATTEISASHLTRGGNPLPRTVRNYFESRFGRDFSSVKIHTGEDAERVNRELSSYAFTYGPHIWFGRGQDVAQTALLAHELTHVVQQTAPPSLDAAESWAPPLDLLEARKPEERESEIPEPEEPLNLIQRRIQRVPKDDSLPPSSNVLTMQFGNGFALVQTPALGRGTLYYQDRVWINFKWDAKTGPDERKLNIDLKTDLDAPVPRLTLKVNVNFRVELQVNQGTEQFMTDVSALSLSTRGGKLEVAIEAGNNGELNTFPAQGGPARSEPLPAKTLTMYTPAPGSENQPIIIRGEGEWSTPAPAPSSPGAPAPLLTTKQQIWIQKDQAAFEDFAKKHPNTNWAGITLPDGRVVAFALTEEVLHSAAEQVRSRDYRFPFQSPFPGSHVTGVVLHGKVLQSINELENLYYSEDLVAAMGVEGDYEEAEVFAMAGHSFGRKPLTHVQAVARWAELDAMPITQVEKLETEPGHEFSMLWVRGLASIHALDLNHFSARAKLLSLPQGSLPLLLDATDPMMKVLEAEADRGDISGPIRSFLENNEPTAEVLQKKIVHQAETTANTLAVRALSKALDPFERIVNSDGDAAVFLMTLAQASEDQRREMLVALGYGKLIGGVPIIVTPDPMSIGTALGNTVELSAEFKRTMRVTGSRDNALRLILGETIEQTSLKSIRERARSTRDEFKRTIDSLGDPENPKVKILYHEGDLGKTVRWEAYRAMGFNTLKPADYPHSQQTKGLFPGPMAAGSFASIAEQMFANYSANHAAVEDLKLLAEIIAAIIITILSDGLGASVAAQWFGGSMAVRLVVSGLTFTALETGFDAVLTGKSPIDPSDIGGSLAKLGGQALLNIAMFAFFKQLDAVFSAFSRSGVRAVMGLSEEAFLASRLARGAANVVRLSGLSAAFTTLSFEQFVIANGRAPTAREASRMAIKSVVSIGAMEVAGALTKSMTSEGGFWGRAGKLDIKTTERTNLLDRIRAVNNDLLSTKLDPDQLNGKSDSLAGRYETLLQDQKQLINDVKPELSAKGDTTAVNDEAASEIARIDAALDALHQAKLIASANISPAGDPASPAEATEFTYQDTPTSRQSIIDQFGESKTKIDKDGVITVTRADGAQLVIRPAPAAQAAGSQGAAQAGSDPNAQPQGTKSTDAPEKTDPEKGDKSTDTSTDKGTQQPDQKAAGASAGTSAGSQTDVAPDFFTRRAALVVRRFTLLRRAAATGLLDPIPEFGPGSVRAREMTKAEVAQRLAAQNAIRGVAGREPGRVRTTKGLAQQEAEVTAAEKLAQPELDRLADLAFARHKERLEKAGLSMDNVRTGKLANLTDRQIGEALAEVPGAQGLSETQLRGILFAAYGKGPGSFINIQRVFDMAGSAAERNGVLDFFAKLMDLDIPGTYEVLQNMTTSRNNWRGGLHVLDFAVNGTGGTRVVAFEFPEALSESGDVSEGGRIYDIILADGTRIQCKNWRNWFGVRSQFRRDILLQTDHFGNTDGLTRIRWAFRAPSPRPPAEIREIMRQTLEDTMTEFNLSTETRTKLRDVFAGHTGLVEEWSGTDFSGTANAPPPAAATATPAP